MAQECTPLANSLLGPACQARALLLRGVWRARVKCNRLPMWVENPSNPADLGPLPLPEPGPATPHPHPRTPGAQNSTHIRKAFSLYCVFPPHSFMCGLSMMQEE